MIKQAKNILKFAAVVSFGSIALVSCESEIDNLGEQFFLGNEAEGVVKDYDVVAYNLNHHDTIQSDASKLVQATLGAFSESEFGLQKSSYVTQVRLTDYNPNFGTNAKVDSVTLELQPLYEKDSATTITKDDEKFEGADAKKVFTSYPIKKYGKHKKPMTIKVEEVNDFLYAKDKTYFSNQQVNVGSTLANYNFDGTITEVKITAKSDNKDLFSRTAAIRVPLDKNFFQTRIIDQQNSGNLKDVASFIRYFKGLRISVAENDGYIFNFLPNATTVKIYYKHDVTTDGKTEQKPAVYTLDLGADNTHFNQIQYQRPSQYITAMANINTTNGDEKLYMQGMGGAGAVVKIPATTIAELKKLYKDKKVGVLSAKVRLYSDKSVWDNSYAKPSNFLVKYANLNEFLADVSAFSGLNNFSLVKAYNLKDNPAYYDITITQTIKDIIEKEQMNRDLEINVGNYLLNAKGGLVGQKYNSRAYAPERVVLIGSNTTNDKKAQLKITYAKK